MGLCGRDKGHTKWLVVQLGQHGNEGKGRPRDTSCRKLARCLCVYLSFLLESRHCIVGLCFFGGVAQTPHQSSSSASFENVTQNPVHCVVPLVLRAVKSGGVVSLMRLSYYLRL